ncbi:thymidine phosphorylase [candidate division BRC1 bacterium HGW-BRC1-1]|jgi:pyrimidine-nucleoside phosphorylase|nr:MAG: thymidine phosphorylase [candidate division BRC1 bacterium HGW-BRC1-1]
MRPTDVIIRKRDGHPLSGEEIAAFVKGLGSGDWADYQTAALLMAIFLQGMNFDETAALTREMMESGETYDLTGVASGGRRPVDKHSTGGVGDKVSLALAPLAAACGLTVPMVSGRGLGHTGGTLDKLEAIPGFQVRLSTPDFLKQLSRLGVAMIGQSDTFVPADKKLYSLRDVTGTVESIPLICASILSKKAASGAAALLMDVKTGSGAFMATVEQARELAKGLAGVGAALGRPVRAMITDMSQPLGRAVGNANETREAIECLRGAGPDDLRTLVVEQVAEMILLAEPTREAGPAAPQDLEKARATATEALDSGKALEKFAAMIEAQGGDARVTEDIELLELASDREMFAASREGVVASVDSRAVGNAALSLGAGRVRASDDVDHAVGLQMCVRIGDRVEAGAPLVEIIHRGGRGLEDCRARLQRAFVIGDESVSPPELILERL